MKLGMASAALALTVAFAGRSGVVRAFTASSSASSLARPSAAFVSSRSFGSSKSSIRSAAEESAAADVSEDVSDDDVDYDGDDSSIYARQSNELEKLQSAFLRTMRDRGFLHQCTNIVDLDDALSKKGDEESVVSAYLGFDATADSLHVGSLLQIMILRHLQRSGHRPVVLIGGGTSKVGDPTGKDESRPQLTDEIIKKNTDGISKVFEKFLTFEGDDDADADAAPTDAIMVNNDDWLSEISYLQFLRDYGTQFTINRMLSFESVKQRLAREAPLTFLEFNYMILQAYDFLELARRYDVRLQLGGSDQWGNMVSGTELGRRVDSRRLFALTAPLITTSDGKKMGKTAGGAIWLNSDRLSEYDYWQFWRNTSDEDVVRFLKLFTELPLEEIGALEQLKGADINKAKVVLADEATALLHGRDCLKKIHDTAKSMFGGGAKNKKGGGGGAQNTDSLPRIAVTAEEMEGDGVRFADLFLRLGLASSKKDARRLIQGGGARLGDDKITDDAAALTLDDFGDDANEVTLRAGKKRAGVVELEK
uniref:Tyrosine--tRNA ligase n=2 Tax=Odontella aurita TaxID=265563 RepID=A0A7S4II76_9STRA|mmetsp:Transcript_25493/g.75109  ORF Transcript_25493/g.75109 Transcript_25493/m.75109 type:complete len:537 (+) Transcript_25493:352-1962(+)